MIQTDRASKQHLRFLRFNRNNYKQDNYPFIYVNFANKSPFCPNCYKSKKEILAKKMCNKFNESENFGFNDEGFIA